MSARTTKTAESAPPSQRFPRSARLRTKVEFERVFEARNTAGDRWLKVWVLRNEVGASRLGLVVGLRHGNAPRRNRLKRVIREAFRLSRAELPQGYDIICTPRPGAELELAECRRSLGKLVAAALR